MNIRSFFVYIVAILICVSILTQSTYADLPSRYAQWSHGPSTDPDYFPFGVFLQTPSASRINKWKAAGINVYNDLWNGPTAAQLNTLQANDMQVICSQNSTGLAYKNATLSDGRPLIIAWRQQGEPDNAQWNGTNYDPRVPTSTIQAIYNDWKANDSTRPIYLGLSQGISWNSQTWFGQGSVPVIPAIDYPQYIAGSDIVAFDVYPMDCGHIEVCNEAWRVAKGVDGLFQYAPANHIVWDAIETGDISANGLKATGEEIRMEVWSSIIHGARGIGYFIHGWSERSDFDEAALLQPENADNLAAVTAINAEVASLASVINSDPVDNSQVVDRVALTNPATPVDYMVKSKSSFTYIFTTSMQMDATTATFNLAGQYPNGTSVEVINENRQLTVIDNAFSDDYVGFETHLYKINTESNNTGVVDRYVFYNNSAFDGNDPAANENDDNAIATDKYALFPSNTTTYANYTSYSKGINGIMVDVLNMPGTLSASDFDFNMGNNSLPDGWSAAPSPVSVSTRVGAGDNGSDRVTIIWADGAIKKQWLKVTIKATAATGLVEPEVFYFGNAVGDTGDQTDNAYVNATDEINCRNNLRHFLNPAAIDDPHDHNRDKRVNASDEIISRNNPTNFTTSLRYFTAP